LETGLQPTKLIPITSVDRTVTHSITKAND